MRSNEINELIKRGLDFQKQGDLESAGRIYGEILEIDQQRADALHLFGIVLHQLGDSFSAIKAISRAIAIRPNLAHYHVNLGEIYRSIGREDRASGCLYLALKLRPEGFDDPTQFDLLIRHDGQFDNVELPPRPPKEVASAESVAQSLKAVELRALGDRAGAFEHFVRAVENAPDAGLPHSNLGQAFLEQQRIEEALYHGNQAIRLAPEHPEPWNHLGNALRASGRSIEARSSYLEALRIAPDMAVAHSNLGRDLLAMFYPKEASVWFGIALEFQPNSVLIRTNLALALKEMGELEQAAVVAGVTISMAPDSSDAQLVYGSILHELRRFEAAVHAFEEAIRLNPESIEARESLGILWTEMGELEAADGALREVLRRPGDHIRALVGLTNIHRSRLPEADFAAIRQLLENPELPEVHRAELHFSSAIVDDGRGDYPSAADHLRKANGIKHDRNFRAGRAYHPEDHAEYIDQMMAAFSVEFFERTEGFGLSTTRPFFIFGLPRSGTSLVEQILSSHSNVMGLGETDFAWKSFESLPAIAGLPSADMNCFALLDRESTTRMALAHLAKLDAIDRETPHLVDKMPDNYLFLGYLATLFPQAKFIHCRRDLRDTAVSCWSTNFWYPDWPTTFDGIASRFTSYQRLMGYWETVLPAPILHLDYEETVNDLETTARTLLDFCGLDWEPSCLAFHEAKRTVRTASVTQVRQPIYRRSVERWRNYEVELGPLFDRLGSSLAHS